MTKQADEEFREFMSGRWPGTVRLAYGLTGDLGHAGDLAQTAFAKAYATWAQVSRSGGELTAAATFSAPNCQWPVR